VNKLISKRLISAFLICFYSPFFSQDETPAPVDSIPPYVRTYEKASRLIDSAKYNDALPMLKKVLKENSDYYMAHNKIALIHLKTKKYKEAEKSLNLAEKISPLNYDTQKLKGILYFTTDRFKESKSAIDSAVTVAMDDKIDDPELFYYQAMLMYKGKSFKTALNSCQHALDMNPKYLEVLVLKGEIRFAMQDHLNAIKDLTDAIKEMPAEKPDYNCYKLRAKSKFELKDFKGVISDWSIVLDADPKNEEALVARAAAKINTNDNTGGIVDLDEAIKINSKNPISYCNRGVAKSGNKSYPEAIKDLDQAIKLKFDYSEAYFRRATVKLKMKGDKQGACDDLAKADSLGDPDAFKLIEQYCKSK